MSQEVFPPLARTKEVAHALGVHRSTLWEWVKSGTFPEPLKVGGRNAWLWTTVRDWLGSKSVRVAA